MAKPYDPKDRFFQKAKEQGFRARSAFKIEEILEKRKARVRELELHFDRSIWARIYLRPIRLAEQRSILILVEDLTLEKRQLLLLNTIARAKKEWELTFDTVSDMIALIDSQQKIIQDNQERHQEPQGETNETIIIRNTNLIHHRIERTNRRQGSREFCKNLYR